MAYGRLNLRALLINELTRSARSVLWLSVCCGEDGRGDVVCDGRTAVWSEREWMRVQSVSKRWNVHWWCQLIQLSMSWRLLWSAVHLKGQRVLQ